MTEKFRIHTYLEYHAPVAFVELIDGQESHSPSTAVRVVREYLQAEVDRMSSNLAFVFMGPSPFHANLWVEGYSTPNENSSFFECKILNKFGYADVTFRCCVENAQFKERAREILFAELRYELDRFYHILYSNRRDYRGWDTIQTIADSLFDSMQDTESRKRLISALVQGRGLSALTLALSKFDANYIQRQHYADKICRELYARDISGFLRAFIETELNNRPLFPIKQMKELVTFAESRRSKAIELVIVLAAAVIGGVAGSVITILVGSGG